LTFVFDNFGPYHEARVFAASRLIGVKVTGIELHPKSRTYAWESRNAVDEFKKISLPNVTATGSAERFALLPHLEYALASSLPDVVFVNGWGDFMSLETIRWVKMHRVRLVVMSETRWEDGARSWWGERVKSRIVSLCDAGLCGGESHRCYLAKLGLPKERVALGYNAVDNDFFSQFRNAKSGMRNGEFTEIEGVGLSVSKNTESIEVEGKVLSHEGTVITEQGDAEASLHLGAHAGASASGSLKSKLADLPVSESLIRYADGPASLPATSHSLPATAPEALTGPYFLASNRFVERKNLGTLIKAYALCVKSFEHEKEAWPLVLLGDGELRGELEALCGELELKTVMGFSRGDAGTTEEEDLKLNSYKLKTSPGGGCVIFAGFRQVEELPAFYAGAGAFIHPALSEPWGLVINEAMASGLPIISSRNVGAAKELVQEGANGFTFNPEDVEELARLMVRIENLPHKERAAMGSESRRIIAKWGPECFAQGVMQSAQAAIEGSAKRLGFLDRLLLEMLIHK
jgi:glycosyltransferase involved in cell wall biosynthesis